MNFEVTLLSLWRDDAERKLHERAGHLLAKRSNAARLRWLWVVGDSSDATEQVLRQSYADRVVVVRCDSDLGGEDLLARRERLARTATLAFGKLSAEPGQFVLLHESDLTSPENVVDRLLSWSIVKGFSPVAGWPTLGDEGVFYDTFAYRHLDDRNFLALEPRPTDPIEVGGFGSVWLAPAGLVAGRALSSRCVADLCDQWKREGVRMWVDPCTRVVQPVDLWTPC